MADKDSLKILEQGRAKFAYECVKKGSEIEKNKEYKAYVKKIPMLIKTNGLGATFAYVKSKKDKDNRKKGYAYDLIYSQTNSWLKEEPKGLISERLKSEGADLIKVLVNLESPEYRAVTNEVVALFAWLKRFADGLIEGVATDE